MPTFKDENRVLQELAREVHLLRAHNLQFKEGDCQDALLMFAEGALTCMALEHFVRIILGPDGDGATLFNLLEMAISRNLIKLPWDDQQDGIRKVCGIRNTLLHANFVQATREAGCESVAHYFRTQYAGEVEAMFKIADFVMKQIDPATGRPLQT